MNIAKVLQNVAKTVLTELVDVTEELQVIHEETNSGALVVLTVKTAKADVGKVIGKRGRNAESLRTLLESIASKHRVKVLLDIDDKRT